MLGLCSHARRRLQPPWRRPWLLLCLLCHCPPPSPLPRPLLRLRCLTSPPLPSSCPSPQVKTRQMQAANPYLGIDCNDVGTNDMRQQNVFETLIGKKQQLMLATQVCKMILKASGSRRRGGGRGVTGVAWEGGGRACVLAGTACRTWLPSSWSLRGRSVRGCA